MQLEIIGDTYKITLGRAEEPFFPENDSALRCFLSELISKIKEEKDISIPDGKLIAEVFTHLDGSRTVFISSLPKRRLSERDSYSAVDIEGAGRLMALCRALSQEKPRCTIYEGAFQQSYRIVFRNPSASTARICAEFGDYCEITRLFAAQSEEYLKKLTARLADLSK